MMLAYVDPGLGQLIWLSIVSAFTGMVFYIKKTRAWIVGIVLRIFRRERQSSMDTAKIQVAEKVEIGPDVR